MNGELVQIKSSGTRFNSWWSLENNNCKYCICSCCSLTCICPGLMTYRLHFSSISFQFLTSQRSDIFNFGWTIFIFILFSHFFWFLCFFIYSATISAPSESEESGYNSLQKKNINFILKLVQKLYFIINQSGNSAIIGQDILLLNYTSKNCSIYCYSYLLNYNSVIVPSVATYPHYISFS